VKRLFLLRHAKSSWDDPGLDDHERRLAPRGRRASKLIGEHLRREGIAPSLVLCSSASRTRETLERVMPAPGATDVSYEDGLYEASSGSLLQRLREVPPDVDSVMLVAHQPAIQELALDLAGDGVDLARVTAKFPTGALATLVFDGDWSELGPGSAELVAFVKPKELTSSGNPTRRRSE
jgi:phosphohistidine phosphatase